MPKVNKPGSHKRAINTPKVSDTVSRKGGSGSGVGKGPSQSPTVVGSGDVGKGPSRSSAGKGDKRRVGGTAVAGAKSTQPREVNPASPAQQQAEGYNRDTRRRMQHLGTGPYGEDPVLAAQEKRQKRTDRKKKRVEERQQEAKKAIGSRFKVSLGRKNTYFLIAVVAIIVIVIVLAIILNHPFSR